MVTRAESIFNRLILFLISYFLNLDSFDFSSLNKVGFSQKNLTNQEDDPLKLKLGRHNAQFQTRKNVIRGANSIPYRQFVGGYPV